MWTTVQQYKSLDNDTTSVSSTTTRSRSPVKIVHQQGTDGGLRLKVLDNIDDINEEHPLWNIRSLLQQLNESKHGVNVLPASFKDTILKDIRCQRDFRRGCVEYFAPPGYHDTIGRAPSIDDVVRIKKKTHKCQELQEHEAGWNCMVHFPLLELAREFSAHANDLYVANITTARIEPDLLLAPERSNEKSRSKLVDFAISLEPSQVTSTAFRNLDVIPYSSPTPKSFNQTPMNTVANRPIALSIETRSQSGSGDEARVQLAVWSSAHFKRLELLLEESAQAPKEQHILPVLPLLSFEGSSCRFLAATKDRSGDKDDILWDCMTLGETDSIRSTYQVINALQLLMRWIQMDYRPWFEKNAAPLSPDERGRLHASDDISGSVSEVQ
ncbi:MAG: hypothetical protein Q9227_006543 [Pyrenula ochraceoflavens]